MNSITKGELYSLTGRNKHKTTQPQTEKVIQGRDLFQTPNYATKLLLPYIPREIKHIWECACGNFKIVDVLLENEYSVTASDLYESWEENHGRRYYQKHNFITHEMDITDADRMCSAIITNPPFSLKEKFYKKCREYNMPFALLIPADYCGWMIQAIQDGCEKIIPTRRIDFITPSGLSGSTGHTSYFHSMWLTWGFRLGRTETFVELTKEMKKDIQKGVL